MFSSSDVEEYSFTESTSLPALPLISKMAATLVPSLRDIPANHADCPGDEVANRIAAIRGFIEFYSLRRKLFYLRADFN